MSMISDLKQYYLERRMTQQELAKKLGVTFITVNRWLNGKAKPGTRQEYQIKKLLEERKNPANYETNESAPGMVKNEDSAYYGNANNFIEQIKLIKDAKTGEEEIYISYISNERKTCKITLSGKEFVKLIENFKKR